MKRAWLLGLLAACSVEPVASTTQPIFNGIQETGRPEVVYLYNVRGSACTASLIAPRVALTAKHCVDAGNRPTAASNLRILVGPTAGRATAQYFVSEVRVAPGRWDLRDGSDVAVLILSSEARETPLQVSFDPPRELTGDTFTAVGYGVTEDSNRGGVKYATQAVVEGLMGNFIYVRPSVCSGDSGGPLIGPEGRVWGVASFIYPTSRRDPVCGDPGAYNAIAPFRDLIETAIEDSGACVPREEECNNIDDNCDGTVDEGCTAVGEPCTDDSECSSQTCAVVTEGAGRICTLPCDPLRPFLGCPGDMYCTNPGISTGSCEGLCAPGAQGEKLLDEDCTTNTECFTGLCHDPGDGRRRCLPPCAGGVGACLAGEVCSAGLDTCGTCVAEHLVLGSRGIGEACTLHDDCTSGVCFEDESVSYCSVACDPEAEEDECIPGFHCRDDFCVRGPREDVGGGCVSNEDCGSGVCATQGERRWCTDFCETDAGCPDGFACVPQGDISVCAPDLNLVGESCEANEECASGVCAFGTRAGDVCTRVCGPDTFCSPGFECVRIDGGRTAVCVPAESGGGGGGGGGCSAGGAPSGVIALMLLPLFFRRRRR